MNEEAYWQNLAFGAAVGLVLAAAFGLLGWYFDSQTMLLLAGGLAVVAIPALGVSIMNQRR